MSGLPPGEGPGAARRELARLLGRGGAPRRLLRQRVELFVAIGAGLGALHLAASRSGGNHVALTAMLSALIPVFAPVCFVPAIFPPRRQRHAPLPMVAVRLSSAAVLGMVVAAVHLAVWAILAGATGSVGGPTPGDIPFMVVVVVVTTAVATLAYWGPARQRLAQPATVGAVVGLYAAAFVVHGQVLTPSLDQVRGKLGPGDLVVEIVAVVVSLAVVWGLMRREVREGARAAAAPSAAPGVAAVGPSGTADR